jgi:hypothetical protein
MHGWNGVDLIKCSSEGARIDTLLKPRPDWLEKTATVITRPGAQGWQAKDAEKLAAALPAAEFQRSSHGPLVIFSRRLVECRPLDPSTNTLHLIPRTPQSRAFTLSNVKDRLSFYRFGCAGIQLTPNPPGSPPASVAMRLKLIGHSRFNAITETGKAPPSLVRFKVQIVDADTGAIVLSADHSIHENSRFDWEAEFAPAWGLCDVILSTENIEAEQGDSTTRQTAYFIDPRLR